MSCGDFKLVGYANLNNILVKEHGYNSIEYLTLASLVKDPIFLQIVEERGIDVKRAGRKAYEALLETKAIKTRSIEDINNALDKNERGAFTTFEARRQAVDYVANIATKIYFNSQFNGIVINGFATLYKHASKKVIEDAINRARDIHKNNPNNENINKAYDILVKEQDNTKQINMLVYYLSKFGTPQDYNYAMLVASLANSSFQEEVALRKNIANVVKQDGLYQVIDNNELGGYITEDSLISDDNLQNTGVDLMTQIWSLSIGEYADFKDHVEDIIKYHIATLPKISSTQKNSDGTFNFERNNLLGVVEFVNSDFITKLLYSSADTSNIDNFLDSIKELSETVNNAKSLALLYDILSKNKVLANKYMMVFNKPIISKLETVIRDGKPYSRVTNPTTNKREIIVNSLYNYVKNNYANDKLNTAREKLLIYRKISNNKTLWDYFHTVIPDIDNATFNLALAKLELDNGRGRALQIMESAITSYCVTIDNGTKNYNTFISNYKKLNTEQKSEVRFPDTFIERTATIGIYTMADILEPVLDVSIELNSRNAKGNLSSDVINRSYITNMNDIIHKNSDKNKTAQAYANQKFKSRQYDHSNFLLERKDANGNIISYGLFRKVGKTYQLTEYAADMFGISLLNGISDHDNGNNDLYNSMSDGDYLVTAIGMFVSQTRENEHNISTANYLLPTPSDAPKNFLMVGPKYSLEGLRTKDANGNRVLDPYSTHPIFVQYYNIVLQELTNMADAVHRMFEFSEDGIVVLNDGVPKFSETYLKNPDAFYELYFKDKKGNVIIEKDGVYELAGNIFKFKRLSSSVVSNEKNSALNKLLGYGMPIDILYGGSHNGLQYTNNEVRLNAEQDRLVREAVANWLNEYMNNGYTYLLNEYQNFLDGITAAELMSFLVNDYLVRDSMYDMFGGDQSFYKSGQDILKRIKEVQASGSPFGVVDFTKTVLDGDKPIAPIQLNGTNFKVSYHNTDGSLAYKDVVMSTTFKAVTIHNTVKNSSAETVDRMEKQLKSAGVDAKTIDRILSPFKDPSKKTATNDAQSYITFEEWVRRLYAAGEINKYSKLIKALSDDTPIDQIDWNTFANRVQIQKNFYYDLYYDENSGIEAPRQIKNAEFVLIPKLIAGTELEQIYDVMTRQGIHQLNTVETVKAAKHNILTLWDKNTGELSNNRLKQFEDKCQDVYELFSYNYLYRQQEVPQHMVDSSNKAAIQIMKKIMDNLDTVAHPELGSFRDAIFRNYVGNIRASFNATCAELGIELKDGKLDLSNGGIAINRNIFFGRFKENAAAQGVDDALLEYFNLDSDGFNNLPLFMSNVSTKLESIANSYFNTNITRQVISGWHAAQLSDFGFKRIGQNIKNGEKQITTSNKLQYRVKKKLKINGKLQDVVVTEIMIPRWSKNLKGMTIDQVPDELRTMIGYRIPTEGKQSIGVFYVKDFLPDANGSTVVVPDEWVTQTGSDFDVDSIYAMSKTFIRTGNTLIPYSVDRYKDNLGGYLNYLKDNVTKATKGKLGKEAKDKLRGIEYKNGKIRVKEKKIENEYKEAVEEAEAKGENKVNLNNIAKLYGMPSYEEYLRLPVEDRASNAARSNAIIENFINILANGGAFEENMTTSNFENAKEANNYYAKLTGQNKATVAPSDFLTQLKWFDAATSGIKLKGISVNRDTFMSIANVTKAYHKTGIKVIYNRSTNSNIPTLQEAINRYGDNVRRISDDIYEVTHTTFGWSNDNKNIDGYLINPYSSQTTAHILDVMKEGAIHNENTYTFNAFKTIVDFGSNYDTAIGFMWQPAMDLITKKWKESNSVMSDGGSNPITEAVRELAINLGFSKAVQKAGIGTILETLDKSGYLSRFQTISGFSSFTEAFNSDQLILSSDAYKNRLTGQINGVDAHLFDIFVVSQFKRLNTIGQDISNNLNVLTADKYGAKQSFYATRKVFDNARDVIDSTEIYAPSSTGSGTPLLESVFPNISGGIDSFLESDINKSSYPSLAAFLQMSSAFSLKCSDGVFETANSLFYDFVNRLSNWTKNGTINESEYNKYKDHIINRSIVGEEASPFIALPVTINNGEVTIQSQYINNSIEAKAIEFQRIAGIRIDEDMNSFVVKDIMNPTDEEVNKFAKFTPAQKVIYIREVLMINSDISAAGIFRYIEPNLNDERDNKNNNIRQYLNFKQDIISNNQAHRMFNRAFASPHPFIRLAAIDIAKYAFVVEKHKFRTRNVSRTIGNMPLYDYFKGGLDIADTSTKAIKNIEYKDANDISDIISYMRTNYDSFPCATYTNSGYFQKRGVNIEIKPNGVIYMTGNLDNTNIMVNDKPRKAIRIGKQLYIGGFSSGKVAYFPVDKLANFESYITFGSSTALYNSHLPLPVLKAQEQDSHNDRAKAILMMTNEIRNWNHKVTILSAKQIFGKELKDGITGMFNRDIKNGIIYTYGGKYYIAATGEKAINMSKENQVYRKDYPNADINSFGVLVEVTQDDINRINNNEDIMYSSVNDQTPIGRALKTTVANIQTQVRYNNPIAKNVISGLSQIQQDYFNSDFLDKNSKFATNLIADYIETEATQLLDTINRFPCKDGIYRPINDPEVIKEVLADQSLENVFLNATAAANVFAKKYKLFADIDLNTLDDKTKELVEKINRAVANVTNNNIARTARNLWLKEWVRTHSHNPNLINGIMSELDAYGDTGIADFYIQDARANRNIIIQTVLTEVATRVEQGRIDGINEAKEFEKKIKEIQSKAAKQGKTATINSVIDSQNRIIRPQNEEWQKEINRLRDEVSLAEAKYGKNSIEHLKAELARAKFLAKTTIHKYLPAESYDLEGNPITIDYENAMVNFTEYALSRIPETFAKYKQLTRKISDILNQSADNITTEEQDRQLAIIYEQIDSLTSKYDEDGNKKIGQDLINAETLENYISGIRRIKETFFDKEVKAGYEAKLKENQAIIARYEIKDSEGNIITNPEELMKVREYRDAKEWLRKNTRYVLDAKDIEELNWAFEELRDPNKGKSILNAAVKNYQAKDEYGIVNGMKIPDSERAKIKQEVYKTFRYTKNNGLPYTGILRNASDKPYIYKREFYEGLTGNKVTSEEEIVIGEKINEILEKYYDPNTRSIKTWEIPIKELTTPLPVEDGNDAPLTLLDLFALLKENQTNKNTPDVGKRIAKFIADECNITWDMNRFFADKAEASKKGNAYLNEWLKVFTEVSEDGDVVPNRTMYGIIEPKDFGKWIDKEKTKAIGILRNNTREVTTQYYYQEQREMIDKYGATSPEYRKWWNDNHYYDPYTRTYKPLRIWTTMRMTDSTGQNLKGKFEPRINQMNNAVKPELINPEYAKSGINKYKVGTGYDNTAYTNLNEFQHELIKELNNIMQKYVFTNSNQKYVDRGYLPALPKPSEMDVKKAIKETFAFFGWSANTPTNTNWRDFEDMTFDKDYEVPNPMLQQLMGERSEKLPDLPIVKLENETDEEFANRRLEVQKERDRITEENNKIHADVANKKWDEIFRNFIISSSRYNAIRTSKAILYNADQIINNIEAYDTTGSHIWTNRRMSTESETEYKHVSQTRTSQQLRNYIRRLVFDMYKDNRAPKLVRFGSLMQNIAGSKYMMMNITGGIANVLTGSNNIMMERLAREYIDLKDWEYGKAEWLKSSVSFMANMFKTDSTSLADAIVKLSNVVDFDRIIEVNGIDGVREGISKLRGLLFSPQTIGEHFMQNTMLFSMMKSHRLIPDDKGGYTIMSKEMFSRETDKTALMEIISGDENLMNLYKEFIDNIKKDDKLRAKYNLYQSNPVYDFIRSTLSKEQQKQYIVTRKKLIKEKEKEFETAPNIYDQFELVDGIARIKGDSKLTYREYAKFVDKVKEVNKKVHGVYDKLGAAFIETKWWGGMVMQYHKHLYPGFKKRYRWNGYYNEATDSIEKGSYTSLIQFLNTPLKDAAEGEINNVGDVLRAFQNYGASLVNFAANIKLNYNLLPENEKANIRRTTADFLYAGCAIIGAIALTGMCGDDDDDNIAYALAMYSADRLASESLAFTPWGAIAEGKKLWSSPVAIQNTIEDLIGVTGNVAQLLINDGFLTEYTTGRYKGLNKFEVITIRNIPVLRNIDRLSQLPQNNSYYKLDKNILGVVPYKEIAKNLFE